MYTNKAAEKHKYITWKITTIILWIHFFMVLKSMNTNLMWQNKFSVTMLYLQLTYSDMRILKTILQICQQKHIPGHTWWQMSVMEWYTAILWVCSSTFSTENVQNNFTFTSISDKFRSSNKHWIKPRSQAKDLNATKHFTSVMSNWGSPEHHICVVWRATHDY